MMLKKRTFIPSICAAVIALASTWTQPAIAVAASCSVSQDIQVRVGPPRVVRGPAKDELDTRFSLIRTAAGFFRGFSSNQTIYRIEGESPWVMSGIRKLVMTPPLRTPDGVCGYWMNDVKRVGGKLIGFVHTEKNCSYRRPVQSHKLTQIAVSDDEGVSWRLEGEILSGIDKPQPQLRRLTGEGDCTAIEGKDGFVYAYCLRSRDWRTIVSRASVTNLSPGGWEKFYAGEWTEPGIGGDATALGMLGTGSAYWAEKSTVFLVGVDKQFGGVKLSLSCDKTSFVSLNEPLVPLDDNAWKRPAPTELYAYPGVFNPQEGSNTIGSAFVLSYAYLQPGADFTQRYLVFRDVVIGENRQASGNQVGIALGQWVDPASQTRWATTGPVIGPDSKFEGVIGYLLTRSFQGAVRLDECASDDWAISGRTMLVSEDTGCGPSRKLRTAGWVYTKSQPSTVALYACSAAMGKSGFISTKPDCGGQGQEQKLLGYALVASFNL